MEPTIIERGQILLIGFSFFGDPFQVSSEWTEENEIGRLWNRLMAFLAVSGDSIKHVKADVGYELHVEHPETAAKGHFEVFVGLEIESLEAAPVELLVKILPATKYAVFTLRGQQINGDWPHYIYQEWLPGSGYQAAYRYNFQYYDQRFKGLDRLDESQIDVYVPIS